MHKLVFPFKDMTHGTDYSEGFPKGDKIVKLSFFGSPGTYIAETPLTSTKALPRISLEEMNLLSHIDYATSSYHLIKVQVFYDLFVYSQVVHNCGHGFSKRLNPAGVYCF